MTDSGDLPGGFFHDDSDRILVALEALHRDSSAQFKELSGRLQKMEATIGGNGRPGLKERLATLETYVKIVAWLVPIATPIISSLVAFLVLKGLGGNG